MTLSPLHPGTKAHLFGMTLIELIVSLAVMGVLAAIAIPSFTASQERTRLRLASEAVYSHLQFARSESIKQYRQLYVSVKKEDGANSTNWCLAISDHADCDCMTQGDCSFGPLSAEKRIVSSQPFKGIGLSATANTLSFEPSRGKASDAGTVTLYLSDSMSVDIVVSLLGRVRKCSNNLLGLPKC